MIHIRVDRLQSVFAALIIVGSGVLIGTALYFARSESVTAGTTLTRSILTVMAEQTSRTVQVADQKMQRVAEELAPLGQSGAIGLRSTDALLRQHLVGMPFVRALWVLDANGRIIADSDQGNIGVSLADREYFAVYTANARLGFFLGAPVRSRSTGTWLISAAYPLRDLDGTLIGVLAAAIEPPYFEKLWGAIDLGPDGAIDLYRQDGTLMASSSSPRAPIGKRTTDAAILASVHAAAGRAPPAGADNGARMILAQHLSAYPQLTLVTQRSWHALLAPWRQFSLLAGGLWLFASLVALYLYRVLRTSWRQRSEAIAALTSSEAKFSAAFQASPDAIVLTRAADGRFVEVSESVFRITGYTREQLIGNSSEQFDIWHDHADRRLYAGLLKTAGRVSNMEAQFRMHSGEVRTGQISGELIDVGGEPHFLGIIRDITDVKRKEALIWEQAHVDSLTRLPNRAMFVETLLATIAEARSAKGSFSLWMIDLDEFKEVNDTLGHEKGDQLLMAVAARLIAAVPAGATVARLGGDEFAIILPEPLALPIDQLLQRVIHDISSPFMLELDRVFVSASVGVARYPDAGTSIVELLRHADQAMYAAKHAGRNRYCHFHQGLHDTALQRASLVSDLRSALAGNQFDLYYQPILSMASGRVGKAEALIRWNHPLRGAISPAEFIPLAESSGLILDMGEWVFEQALAQVRRIHAHFDPAFQISINVSPVQIHGDPALPARWIRRLRESGVAPHGIVVEITEGVLLDLTRGATDTLTTFTEAGVAIALDDFGTGYSSLAYLRKFHIDYLKIDRAFVRNIESTPDDLALCEAIAAMAHKLGMSVIVEGIETQGQMDLTTAMQCEFGQGFLFSKALPAREFERVFQHELASPDVS